MRTTRSTHEYFVEIASRQHGVVGRAQLVTAGFSTTQVDRARRARRLLPVFRGVYAVGREVEVTASVWRAATIAAGDGAVLMGTSAGEAWGMLAQRPGLPKLVEVARPGEPGVLRARSAVLPNTKLSIMHRELSDREITRINGIPLTSPASTFIELAGQMRPSGLRRAFIEGCRLGRIRRADLEYLISRSRNRPGAEAVREMVGLWVPGIERTRSVLEGLFLLGWVKTDSRIPEVNVKIGRYEVDFLWRREQVVVETDGRAYHRHEIARRRDAEKDAWLRAQGLTVIRLGYIDVDQAMAASCAAVKTALDG